MESAAMPWPRDSSSGLLGSRPAEPRARRGKISNALLGHYRSVARIRKDSSSVSPTPPLRFPQSALVGYIGGQLQLWSSRDVGGHRLEIPRESCGPDNALARRLGAVEYHNSIVFRDGIRAIVDS